MIERIKFNKNLRKNKNKKIMAKLYQKKMRASVYLAAVSKKLVSLSLTHTHTHTHTLRKTNSKTRQKNHNYKQKKTLFEKKNKKKTPQVYVQATSQQSEYNNKHNCIDRIRFFTDHIPYRGMPNKHASYVCYSK